MKFLTLALLLGAFGAHAGPRDAELGQAIVDIKTSLNGLNTDERLAWGAAGAAALAGVTAATLRIPALRITGSRLEYFADALGVGTMLAVAGYIAHLKIDQYRNARYVARANRLHHAEVSTDKDFARFLSLDPGQQFLLAENDEALIDRLVEFATWAKTVRSVLQPKK